ncbi:anthranilate phosphoribosyltransferase, partial [Buchnera aphidicola (Hormaphis cornu)]
MEEIFNKLYQMKSLNKEEAFNLFNLVNKKKLNDIQLAVILILMKIKGESINEILGAIQSFTKYKKHFPISNKYIFSDITGTGGDKSNGMNISTISALVAASCGFKISKHCNYTITGKIGSSNFLEKLGINLHLSAVEAQKNLDYLNICFLLAPLYYKGFKFSTKVRKTLRTRTIFNLIGPLLNPSKPTLTVIGVYKKNFMLPMAKVLKKLKYQRAILIHSKNNDEITLSGHNDVVELKNNQILSYQLYPKDFGLNICSRSHFLCNT